jgi:hypothetical protein
MFKSREFFILILVSFFVANKSLNVQNLLVWLYGLESTNFVHSESYLQQKKIKRLKQKLREHTGTKNHLSLNLIFLNI